ncbi:MAG: aspartate kinase, partial [Deltaproteobacteria bacterium]|nr:aspartate kinase [Deltaproteobacteria bacterium]
MRILVQKFGGTSVADLECMKQVRHKVAAALERGYKLVAVVSARSGHTNSLYELAAQYSPMPDAAEEDVLVAVGEQMSAALFAMMLRDTGIRARSMLGWQVPIQTDNAHSQARIRFIDDANLRQALETYDVVVMAGFQGV